MFLKNVSEECGIDSKLAISDSKCASFVEANNSTVKSRDSLYFQTSSLPEQANNSKSVDQSTVKSKDLLYQSYIRELKQRRSRRQRERHLKM